MVQQKQKPIFKPSTFGSLLAQRTSAGFECRKLEDFVEKGRAHPEKLIKFFKPEELDDLIKAKVFPKNPDKATPKELKTLAVARIKELRDWEKRAAKAMGEIAERK